MKFEVFKCNIEGWASEVGIYEYGTKASQLKKFGEELGEYLAAKDHEERKKEIGDMVVCIINIAYLDGYKELNGLVVVEQYGLFESVEFGRLNDALSNIIRLAHNWEYSFEECLQLTWDKLSKRTGKMIGETYVKSS